MAFWSKYFEQRRQKQLAAAEAKILSSSAWLGQAGYRGTDAQFDENGKAVQLPVYGVAPPTLVSAIQGAIAQLEQGTFYAADYLWDGMTRDERLASTLNVRLSGLFGQEQILEPAKDTNRARKIADDFKAIGDAALPMPQLKSFLSTALGQSVAVAQVLTTRTAKSTTPTLLPWKNRYLRFDWMVRKYLLVTENRGEIVLEPGDPEWVIYEPFGPYGWLNGALIRPLVTPWLIRYWVRMWWSRYQEVHGQPMRAGIVPSDRKPADERLFLSQLSNLAHEAVIRLPQGQDGNKFDLKLIEAQANNWQGFKELLNHCDDSIAVAILGQRQSTAGQGGLGSQENAGESTIQRILRMVAKVGDSIRDQFIKKWAADNYGDPEMAPYLRWQIDPPEDEGAKAKTDLTISQALQGFKTSSAPIDQRKFLEARGYGDLLMSEQEHAQAQADAIKQAQQVMNGATKEDDGNGNADGVEPDDGNDAGNG